MQWIFPKHFRLSIPWLLDPGTWHGWKSFEVHVASWIRLWDMGHAHFASDPPTEEKGPFCNVTILRLRWQLGPISSYFSEGLHPHHRLKVKTAPSPGIPRIPYQGPCPGKNWYNYIQQVIFNHFMYSNQPSPISKKSTGSPPWNFWGSKSSIDPRVKPGFTTVWDPPAVKIDLHPALLGRSTASKRHWMRGHVARISSITLKHKRREADNANFLQLQAPHLKKHQKRKTMYPLKPTLITL